MPDVHELFQLSTQKVLPDPGALQRQGARQRRRVGSRRAGVLGVVAALAATAAVVSGLTALTGDGGAGTPPSKEVIVGGLVPTASRLAGIWLLDGGTTASPGEGALLVRFSPDGTVVFDSWGTLDTTPAVRGTYRLEGRVVSFRAGSQSIACRAGDTWTWQAGLPEEGRLKAVIVEDGTDNCRTGLGTELTFTRVSPLSPYFDLTFPTVGSNVQPPPDAYAVAGIWLLKGSGALLRLSGEGTYAIDDAGRLGTAPSDSGTFRVHGRTLTFTSGAGSSACHQGDTWVWRGVGQRLRALRGTVTRDECPARVGGATWNVHDIVAYRLSPA